MDNFPSQHGARIGIEIEADIDDVESNDEHDMDMMDLDENENDLLGELQQLLLDKKNVRIIRHLTDSSVDRISKHKRALSQATRPLYLAIARVFSISLPDNGSKLQMHNVILDSVWMGFSFVS